MDPKVARLVAQRRWADVVGAVERLVETTEDPATKADLLVEVGDVWRDRLAHATRAADAFERAHELAPKCAACAAAVTALQTAFPNLPLGFPDRADTAESNFENLVVVAWEDEGLQRLVEELAAREVMEFWATDHYRALYRTVIDHRREVRSILRALGLMGE
jgi:hypothetical protein